jgi:flagellar FliJ protein
MNPMDPLAPLKALLAQTERERDAVRGESLRADAAHQAALRQSEQLVGYRRDYEQRWGEQFGRLATMDVLHCYQGFMVRLGQAVDQQQRVVELAAARAERERARLAEQELRVLSVRRLIERRAADIRRGLEVREQKQTDEFAARRAWQAASAAPLLHA